MLKNTILLCCCSLFLYWGQAEEISKSLVPDAVLQACKLAYPKAKIKHWEMIEQQYFAHLKTSTGNEIARFYSTGEWLETTIEISIDELPMTAYDFCLEKYPAYSFLSTSYIEKKDGKPYYKVLLRLKENKKVTSELSFDMTGVIERIDGMLFSQMEDSGDENVEMVVEVLSSENEYVAPELQALTDEVKKMFFKKFRNAEKVSWGVEEEFRIAHFYMNGFEREACFLTDGLHVYTAQYFDVKNLPVAMDRYLSAEHPKAKVLESKKIAYESVYKRKFAKKPKDYYRLRIEERIPRSKDKKYWEIYFDQSMQFDMKMEYEP